MDLTEYARSPQERDVARAAEEGLNNAAIAERLGITPNAVRARLSNIRRRAAQAGANLPTGDPGAPEGFAVSQTWERRDASGDLKSYTVHKKSDSQTRARELFLERVNETFAWEGFKNPAPPPLHTNADLCSTYLFGDPHIGMYAWAQESGEDFDCDIAERELTQAMRNLVITAPEATEARVIFLGDNQHMDNFSNSTSRSGHKLDVDSRWGRVFDITVRVAITTIDEALVKHDKVFAHMIQGNHDDVTALALSKCLKLYYANDPRVWVDDSPALHRYFRFGKCRVGLFHGHAGSLEKLGDIMTRDIPEGIAETPFRYWYTGHIHSRKVFELSSCRVESFSTLAPNDAHGASQYRSVRAATRIDLHREFGETNRFTAGIQLVRKGM